MRRAAIFILALLAAVPAWAGNDPYSSLQLYDGAWTVKTDTGLVLKLQNRCKSTGLFFVCEQVVGDRTAALVVFLPTGKGADGEETYRTQALGVPAESSGGWNHLAITGNRWIFAPEDPPAGQRYLERTVNVFIDNDHIHFEVQHSTDGGPWTRKSSGDEQRVR